MNKNTLQLVLGAGVALAVAGLGTYLAHHHRLGAVLIVLGALAAAGSFALRPSRTA